ncbi:hypothetical protein [Actinokineospora spheciospongiae]|nr:hypothetical protein [Actinokineospora spheciospongiae]
MTTDAHDTTPTDHLRRILPPATVLLAPAPPHTVPLRAPAGVWGLVVVAVRMTPAAGAPVRFAGDDPTPDPAHTDTTDLMAGVWLLAPPPADLHTGDVVVRLHPLADADPDLVDVEVLAATKGQWQPLRTWHGVDARWPHHIAESVALHMTYLAECALSDAQWAIVARPMASAMPGWQEFGLEPAETPGVAPDRPAHDALAALITAGLIGENERLELNHHKAIVGAGGGVYLKRTNPFDVGTLTYLAAELCGCAVNGWHLWRRADDHRLLADLRTELATH